MLQIKTKVNKSKIHGFGLFADEFVPKGALIWKFTPGFDQKFTEEQVEELSKSKLNKISKLKKKYFEKYAYWCEKHNKYIFPIDDAKYFNHSKNPNSLSEYKKGEKEVLTFAIKDIKKGEEITDSYDAY